jgi:hypothetical protein
LIPAPWTLTGEGFILLYRFPRDFAGIQSGGLGTVMLVDYATSPVGPYRELLLIPGHTGRGYTITHIFVSTMESVVNGRHNWAIPKEQADFDVIAIGERTRRWHITAENTEIDLTLTRISPHIPINTRWSPVQPALIQDNRLKTSPHGSGKVALARLDRASVSGWPNFSIHNPLVALESRDFQLIFPPAVNVTSDGT